MDAQDILFQSMNPDEITKNLIDFDIVFDLDLSIVSFILLNSNDTSLINPTIYKFNDDINIIRNILLFRPTINPLTGVLKEEYFNQADKLYKEILDKYKSYIIKNILFRDTTLYDFILINKSIKSNAENTINCHDELEAEFVNNNLPSVNTVINERDLSNFNNVYLHNARDIALYKNVNRKRIYVANARYNMIRTKSGYSLVPEILLLSDSNIIGLINLYKNLLFPRMEDLTWEK